MNIKKIVSIGLICSLLMGTIGCVEEGTPERQAPPSKEGVEGVKGEYIEFSAYDFARRLFDSRLTELQRQDLWDKYEGRRVRWAAELDEVEPAEDGAMAFFWGGELEDGTQIRISAAFGYNQKSVLLKLKAGDLVIYTGTLGSFSEDVSGKIGLRNCVIISLALSPLWSNEDTFDPHYMQLLIDDKALYIGSEAIWRYGEIVALDRETGELLWIKEAKYRELGAIDSRYVYDWTVKEYHEYFSPFVIDGCFGPDDFEDLEVRALDKNTGEVMSTWPEKGMFDVSEVRRKFREKTMAVAGPEVIFLRDKPSGYEGVIYEFTQPSFPSSCFSLQAFDPESDSTLWVATFNGKGVRDFIVADGILYISYCSSKDGVSAFKLLN